MQALLDELEQLAKRVPVGGDSVRTRLTLPHQAVGRKSFQQRSESGRSSHGCPSHRRSRRAMASCINSGQLCRYQVCAAAHTWYLSSCPELMGHAVRRLEKRWEAQL